MKNVKKDYNAGGMVVHALKGLNINLTMIAGVIPAGLAAKKDPVEALRSE